MTNRRNKFVCSKISSSMSAMWFSAIFLPAQHNVILTLPLTEICAAVGSVFVCNHMESALFTIICNHGNQPLMRRLPLIFFLLHTCINTTASTVSFRCYIDSLQFAVSFVWNIKHSHFGRVKTFFSTCWKLLYLVYHNEYSKTAFPFTTKYCVRFN